MPLRRAPEELSLPAPVVVSHRPPEAADLMAFPAWYLPYKRALELVVGCLLCPLVVPVTVLAALLVKLTSRGPAFYTQTRVGWNGRPFRVYKLRTMVHDCERHSGPQWSRPNDPRVTPLGRFLRQTHLDEFPQLWNVFRGEMSLVGPRPERPEFVVQLEAAIPGYRQRLLVRPGVTGLAQVQLPPDTDLESVCRKLTYDLFYVQTMSPWLDLRIVLSTALKVIGFSFPTLRSLFGMPSPETVQARYRRLATAPEPRPRWQPA
jgi:lipopolysaccharide/colanic/teichoic acid biosynthesis glycosyltransferase